jgi:hypothetical protein
LLVRFGEVTVPRVAKSFFMTSMVWGLSFSSCATRALGLLASSVLVVACGRTAREVAPELEEIAPPPLCGVPGVDAPWPTSADDPDLWLVERTGALEEKPAKSWWLMRCGNAVQGESCQVTFERERSLFDEPGRHVVADPGAASAALEARLRERFVAEGFVEVAGASSKASNKVVVANAKALVFRRGERERTLVVVCSGQRCTVEATDERLGCAAPGGTQAAVLAPEVEPGKP